MPVVTPSHRGQLCRILACADDLMVASSEEEDARAMIAHMEVFAS